MNPLVSVIIPTYNYGRFISQCIHSVLRQSYPDFEIIVVDDGSTDDTEARVGDIPDGRIRYLRTGREGNYFARNTGISAARGEYIAFLDSDDLWLKNKLEAQMDVFRSRPHIQFCYTAACPFLERDEGPPVFFQHSKQISGDTCDPETIRKALISQSRLCTSSAVVRRNCLERAGRFDTAFQNGMDYDLWLRIIFNHEACYLDRILVYYRKHPSNHSRRSLSLRGAEYALDKIFERSSEYKALAPHHIELARAHRQSVADLLGREYLFLGEYEAARRYFRISGHRKRPWKWAVFHALEFTAAVLRNPALTKIMRRGLDSISRRRSLRIIAENQMNDGNREGISEVLEILGEGTRR